MEVKMIKKSVLIVMLFVLVFMTGTVQSLASAQSEGQRVYLPLVLKNFFIYGIGWDTKWQLNPGYEDPQDLLADEATWETFADLPYGDLPDPNRWYPMEGESIQVNVKSRGFSYVATGGVIIDNGALDLEYKDDNAYLIIFRGQSESRDVNLKGYAGGIVNEMPSGPYVTLGWILDQIENVANPPNCTNGCSTATVVVIDLTTDSYRIWEVTPSFPRNC